MRNEQQGRASSCRPTLFTFRSSEKKLLFLAIQIRLPLQNFKRNIAANRVNPQAHREMVVLEIVAGPSVDPQTSLLGLFDRGTARPFHAAANAVNPQCLGFFHELRRSLHA